MSRGFAAMPKDKLQEIARRGGQAAHAKGTAHEFTSEEARVAGQKGGAKVAANRAHMAEMGRLGGQANAKRRAYNARLPRAEAAPATVAISEKPETPAIPRTIITVVEDDDGDYDDVEPIVRDAGIK